MKSRRWWNWSIDIPVLILATFFAGAILYGLHINADNSRRNCAATVYSLRVILQKIEPAPDADAGLRATIADLNRQYAQQYRRIYRFIDGDSCVDLLPWNAPPTPTAP